MKYSRIARLARRLDLARWQAVGLIESLRKFVDKYTPQGNIGRFSDEQIALSIDYQGDESELMDALISAGWMRRSQTDRLVVCDPLDPHESIAADSVSVKSRPSPPPGPPVCPIGNEILAHPKLSKRAKRLWQFLVYTCAGRGYCYLSAIDVGSGVDLGAETTTTLIRELVQSKFIAVNIIPEFSDGDMCCENLFVLLNHPFLALAGKATSASGGRDGV